MPLGVKTHFSGQVIYFQKEKEKKEKKNKKTRDSWESLHKLKLQAICTLNKVVTTVFVMYYEASS